jgi:FkbM family methyltransferase
MSRSPGLLRRLQRRRTESEVADQREVPTAEPRKLGVAELLEATRKLTIPKQLALAEQWPGAETTLANGTVVTTRSKKEHRRFTRPIEAEMLRWLEGLTAGDVLYDIGANCGSLTLATGAMHGASVKVVAIEPGYANFESMVRNLSRNDMLGFVVPLQVALLDRTRLEPINYNIGTAAGLSLHAVGRPVNHMGEEFTAVETQMVLAYAIDDLLDIHGLPAPTHVKIDVDGVEGPLLEGATRTLASGSIEELLVEIVDHDGAGTRIAAITTNLERHGYELAETFRHHADDRESFVADYLFRKRGDR